MATVSRTGIAEQKVNARAAMVGLAPAAGKLVAECFRQFSIEVLPLAENAAERLQKERFEALVVPLDGQAENLLQVARNSSSNKRAVIFGVSVDPQAAMRFSRHGINAVFEQKWLQEPMDRDAVLRVVRATHLLVARELRRYVRVPIVTEVAAQSGKQRFTGYTLEISAGGLSMSNVPRLAMGEVLQLSFTLPEAPRFHVSASVCWVREGDDSLGARFDPADDRRNLVRDWIEKYLESS